MVSKYKLITIDNYFQTDKIIELMKSYLLDLYFIIWTSPKPYMVKIKTTRKNNKVVFHVSNDNPDRWIQRGDVDIRDGKYTEKGLKEFIWEYSKYINKTGVFKG